MPARQTAMEDKHASHEAPGGAKGSCSLGKRKRTSSGEGDVPVFIRTLYTLLDECDTNIGRWSEDGTQIVIVDPARFAAEICPKFFRHRNFNSFTRLLNMYQFHKVQGSSQDSKLVCFAHAHFARGQEDQLSRIQRKSTSSGDARDGQPRTGVEALVTRDVWEKTNQEIDELQERLHHDSSTAVSTWMRKVLQLEREVRHLREKNSGLRTLDAERSELYAQLATQNKLINDLQTDIQVRQEKFQQKSLDPLLLLQTAMQQANTADPIADFLKQMGVDPAILLASLGVSPNLIPLSALSACFDAMANPVGSRESTAASQLQSTDPLGDSSDPMPEFFDIFGAEDNGEDTLMQFMSQLQNTMQTQFQDHPSVSATKATAE